MSSRASVGRVPPAGPRSELYGTRALSCRCRGQLPYICARGVQPDVSPPCVAAPASRPLRGAPCVAARSGGQARWCGHDADRTTAPAAARGRSRRRRRLRRIRGLGGRRRAAPLPAPGGGAARDRVRRERDPVARRPAPARAWSRSARTSPRWPGDRRTFYTAPIKALVSEKFFALCDVFGAGNVGMLTGDAARQRRGADHLLHRRDPRQHRAARRRRRRRRPGRDGRVPLLRRPGPRLGLAGAAARAAAGPVPADVGDARRRHPLRATT